MNEQERLEENRLATLEARTVANRELLEEIKEDLVVIKKEVADVKLTFAKAGGVLLGFTLIGAFFGYVLTQIDKLKHLFGGN